MTKLYSQRDARWASHPLGWGPALGTIGAFGCYDTVCAMIANDAGIPEDPAIFDDWAVKIHEFMRDPTGTYDFLPDNALDVAFPGRFHTTAYAGFRGDLIDAAIPRPHQYAYVHIRTTRVPSHFVWMFSKGPNYQIADPWYGAVGYLSGYGGPIAVDKTYIVDVYPASSPTPPPTAILPPAPVAAPPPAISVPIPVVPPLTNPAPPPVVCAPAPIPVPTPPPVFRPVGSKLTYADAIGLFFKELLSLWTSPQQH